jgi:hypothetical protein
LECFIYLSVKFGGDTADIYPNSFAFWIPTGMADPKRAAATSRVFIVTKTLLWGFLGQSVSKPIDFAILLPLALVVLASVLIGVKLG